MNKINFDAEELAGILATPLYANNAGQDEYRRGSNEGERRIALDIARLLYKKNPKECENLMNLCLKKKFEQNAAKSAVINK